MHTFTNITVGRHEPHVTVGVSTVKESEMLCLINTKHQQL